MPQPTKKPEAKTKPAKREKSEKRKLNRSQLSKPLLRNNPSRNLAGSEETGARTPIRAIKSRERR